MSTDPSPTPQDIDPAEFEALIEEARARARARRRRYLLAALASSGVAVVVALLVTTGDDRSGTDGGEAGGLGVDAGSGVVRGEVTLTLSPRDSARSETSSGSTTIAFEGPFISSREGLPQFDLGLRWTGTADRPISFSLIATESAGHLVYGDRTYEVSQSVFDPISSAEVLSELHPEQWLDTEASGETEGSPGETAGASGPLDVSALLSDLGRAANGLGLDFDSPVPSSSLSERRISLETGANGVEGLALAASWTGRSVDMGPFTSTVAADREFAELDEPQHVAVPGEARPIDDADLSEFPTELGGLVEFLKSRQKRQSPVTTATAQAP